MSSIFVPQRIPTFLRCAHPPSIALFFRGRRLCPQWQEIPSMSYVPTPPHYSTYMFAISFWFWAIQVSMPPEQFPSDERREIRFHDRWWGFTVSLTLYKSTLPQPSCNHDKTQPQDKTHTLRIGRPGDGKKWVLNDIVDCQTQQSWSWPDLLSDFLFGEMTQSSCRWTHFSMKGPIVSILGFESHRISV